MTLSAQAEDALHKLRQLWTQEGKAVRQRFREARRETPLDQRIERGDAIDQLTLAEAAPAPGNRTLLWLVSARDTRTEDLRLRPGTPVVLWREDPEEPDAVEAVVPKLSRGRIGVMVDGDIPDLVDNDGFHLDKEDPQVTFARGKHALTLWKEATGGDIARLREVLFGPRQATTSGSGPQTYFDTQLHEAQQSAVHAAMCADDIALIHGPPGTGKTRTLVEVIRQANARGERVLATAASNMAVDNLATRLATTGLDVVRLGHPARVSAPVEEITLEARLESAGVYKLTRGWTSKANELRRKISRKGDRGTIGWAERKELRREANALMRDARQHIDRVQKGILERADVICVTATGADTRMLEALEFDLVVLDEATQAPDPIALIPLARAKRAVLAGDPHQLPPTIIDPDAAAQGLAITRFEALASGEATTLLVEQHRMHADIMAFPSLSKYEGELVAAPAVEGHRLEDLGCIPDPERDHPIVFIDTAGKGWEDERDTVSGSTRNHEQAARTAAEARRVLSRGLATENLAIITPYDAQARLLREILSEERDQGLEISSVDGFQGREKEAIIVDLVRSNDLGEIGFLKDTRRMNVALTRARRLLIVIGDSATITTHPYYEAFYEHVQTHGLWVSAWSDEAETLA